MDEPKVPPPLRYVIAMWLVIIASMASAHFLAGA
jgi:hypothetical protein